MKFDLACEERFFNSAHPFTEPGFVASRNLTTIDTFQYLFGKGVVGGNVGPMVGGNKGNPLGLNPTDMFLLIHRMFLPLSNN
jgi:hypothetical protein